MKDFIVSFIVGMWAFIIGVLDKWHFIYNLKCQNGRCLDNYIFF